MTPSQRICWGHCSNLAALLQESPSPSIAAAAAKAKKAAGDKEGSDDENSNIMLLLNAADQLGKDDGPEPSTAGTKGEHAVLVPEVLQQGMQQGSSSRTLPGCMGLPTGLHLHTVHLPAHAMATSWRAGAELPPVSLPPQCCHRPCSPPARLAQPCRGAPLPPVCQAAHACI